ncbi:MAG: transcriptional regulator PpsR [Pseudomonadota bacterium]
MNAHFLKSDILEIGLPKDFVALVSSVSDIALITDRDGKILDIIWQLDAPDEFDPRALIGDSLLNIVTTECTPKIAEMLRADGPAEGGRQREINHRIDGIEEFPVRYNAVGAGESVIFLGHEIRAIAALQTRLLEAQRALDEDYSRLRQLETQYRVLFQTSSEPLLVIDAQTGKIEDANGAAAEALGVEVFELRNRPFESQFSSESRVAAREALQSVTSTGQASSFDAVLQKIQASVSGSLSIFRAANSTMVLCSISLSDRLTSSDSGVEDLLLGIVARIPDAMVLTDSEGKICWCNDAFLGMSEIALAPQAEGESLARFLGRPGVDLDIIIANAQEHGRLRAFSSLLTGAFGSETRVEVSVAALADPQLMIGFVMRDISRYDQIPARKPDRKSEQSDELINLVGSVPLKELVRASTEEIEKMCIEAALKKTGDNRASAAEMLGLSRQSLYVKLRRFGLLDREGQ